MCAKYAASGDEASLVGSVQGVADEPCIQPNDNLVAVLSPSVFEGLTNES
jgi:hypothetical protein